MHKGMKTTSRVIVGAIAAAAVIVAGLGTAPVSATLSMQHTYRTGIDVDHDAATPCSCTASSSYWSSTTFAGFPDFAWVVGFGNGGVDSGLKSFNLPVRAVRGGL